MKDTHDVLVDAAEQLVRSEGLDALSMRTLASRTNYGKSTVHEALGSATALIAELRTRAVKDMLAAAIGDADPDPHDAHWRKAMYRRVAAWVIDNPHWAEICFRPEGASGRWAHGMASMLVGALPAGVAELDPEDGLAIAHLAVRTVGAVVPLVSTIGDVDYAADCIETAFETVYANLVRLVAFRGLDTSMIHPPLSVN